MKRLLLTAAVIASTLMPITASASDRYRGGGYSRGHDYGYRGGYYGGHSRGGSSFSFSFGLFGGPRYYEPYYRPVYRSYYPPPVYYSEPVYVAPAPRYYYYDDCYDYYRPSISFRFGRYYR